MSALLELLLGQARKSDCDKIKFGAAAFSQGGALLGTGRNHNPHPFADYSCGRDCVGQLRSGVRSGTCVERCYAIHAEQAALLAAGGKAFRVAVAGLLPDGRLFDNGGGFYCTVCARLMASAGVEVVTIWSGGAPRDLTMAEAWAQSYSIATAPSPVQARIGPGDWRAPERGTDGQ